MTYDELRKIKGRPRVALAIFAWLFIFCILVLLGSLIFGPKYGSLLGLAIGSILVGSTIKVWVISVPEITGLVTIDLFHQGILHPYGPGLHFRYPWEQVKEGNYINLRLVTQERNETYPSGDGPAILIRWSFQYKPRLEALPTYIAVDETTINEGLINIGSSYLSAKIASLDAEETRKKRPEIEAELLKKYEPILNRQPNEPLSVEELYGIDLIKVSLADVDYEKTYQQARTTNIVAKRIKQTAKDLQTKEDGTPNTVSDKDALNTALIINGDIEKNVQEVEGEGLQALSGIIMASAKAIGGKGDAKGKNKKGGKDKK
ncbi:MAG: SPFH domain-containing protein [Candidatus Azambacteria bacterium]|nr:SPFH domain-containing protein [Candidatus Azambacteria bacterium]